MKRIFVLFTILCFSNILFSQNKAAYYPMKYQAVVRDNAGQILANQNVSFRISILQDEPTGTVMFQEEHVGITTNEYGLINLVIGDGNYLVGNTGSPDWGTENYLQIELDVNGGTDYQLMGTSLLMYAPKALYAEDAGHALSAENEYQQLSIDGNELSISGTLANTVTLPSELPAASNGAVLYSDGTDWLNSSILFHDIDNIGVGTNTPYGYFDVYTTTFAAPALNSYHGGTSDGTVAIRAKNALNNYGYLGVFGSDDFDGISSLDISGHKIGVLGVSTLMNSAYGVYGYAKKYGGYFENSTSGNNVALGGSDAAIEVDGGAVFGAEANAVKITDIIELTGNTDAVTKITTINLPSGWTAGEIRILTYEVFVNNDRWVSGNITGYNTHDNFGYICFPEDSSFLLNLPDEATYKDIPYRIVLMHIE